MYIYIMCIYIYIYIHPFSKRFIAYMIYMIYAFIVNFHKGLLVST